MTVSLTHLSRKEALPARLLEQAALAAILACDLVELCLQCRSAAPVVLDVLYSPKCLVQSCDLCGEEWQKSVAE